MINHMQNGIVFRIAPFGILNFESLKAVSMFTLTHDTFPFENNLSSLFIYNFSQRNELIQLLCF